MRTIRRARLLVVSTLTVASCAVTGCTSSDGDASPPATSPTAVSTTIAPSASAGTVAPRTAPYRPMTATRAAAVLAALRHAGWDCFASLSYPYQVDRCFFHPGRSTDPLRGTVYLVHKRPRSAGGGVLQSAQVYAAGKGKGAHDDTAVVAPVGRIFAAELLGGQAAALTSLHGTATFDGIEVERTSGFYLSLHDQHVFDPTIVGTPAFATTAQVSFAVRLHLDGWTCRYAADFSCRGSVDGSRTLLLRAVRDRTKAESWSIGPTAAAPTGDTRALLEQEITVLATAGVITAVQQRYLRTHVGRSLDADIGGHNIGLLDSHGPALVVRPIELGF